MKSEIVYRNENELWFIDNPELCEMIFEQSGVKVIPVEVPVFQHLDKTFTIKIEQLGSCNVEACQDSMRYHNNGAEEIFSFMVIQFLLKVKATRLFGLSVNAGPLYERDFQPYKDFTIRCAYEVADES